MSIRFVATSPMVFYPKSALSVALAKRNFGRRCDLEMSEAENNVNI
jgi:hypothetical protein